MWFCNSAYWHWNFIEDLCWMVSGFCSLHSNQLWLFLSFIDEFLYSLYWVLFYTISFSDECMCSDNGMTYYTPISADGCANYMVYSDLSSASRGQVLNCPAGLLFDVCTCTCNYPQGMTCPSTCMRNTP